MPRSFSLILLLLGLLFCVAGASAVAQSAQQPRLRNVVYRGVALERSISDLWVQDASGVMRRLPLSDSRVSPPFTSRVRDNELVLYRRLNAGATEPPATVEAADDEEDNVPEGAQSASVASPAKPAPAPLVRDIASDPNWEAVGRAQFPPEGREFLLLVLAVDPFGVGNGEAGAGEPVERYRVFVVPHDDVAHKGGQIKFYNYSSFPIGSQLNDETFTIAPNTTALRTPAEGGQINQGLRIAAHGGDEWKLVFSSVWDYRPHLNTLILMFNDPRQSGAVVVKRLFDQPAPQPAP